MSQLLAAHDTTIIVAYGHFHLATAAETGDEPQQELGVTAEVAHIVDGSITLISGFSDHTAAVRVELWDTAPANQPADALVESGEGNCDGNPLLLAGVATGELHELPLPVTPSCHGVQILCQGREQMNTMDPVEIINTPGQERWTIRLWPIRPHQPRSLAETPAPPSRHK